MIFIVSKFISINQNEIETNADMHYLTIILGKQGSYRVDSAVLNKVAALIKHLPASFNVAIKLLSITCARRGHFQLD